MKLIKRYFLILMILSIGTFLYCKGKSLNTKSNMSQVYIATVDTASIDNNKITLPEQIKLYLNDSRKSNLRNSFVKIDTIVSGENTFLHIRKDGGILFNKLNHISLMCDKMYKSYSDHSFIEDIELFSYRKDNFVSFLYSVIDEGFHRGYSEKPFTFIVRKGNVYQVNLITTPMVQKIINKKVLSFPKSLRSRFEMKEFYGFCLISGNICIRPIAYSALDDDGGDWIKIPYSSEIKFSLVKCDQILKEISDLTN